MLRWMSTRRHDFYYTPSGRVRYGEPEDLLASEGGAAAARGKKSSHDALLAFHDVGDEHGAPVPSVIHPSANTSSRYVLNGRSIRRYSLFPAIATERRNSTASVIQQHFANHSASIAAAPTAAPAGNETPKKYHSQRAGEGAGTRLSVSLPFSGSIWHNLTRQQQLQQAQQPAQLIQQAQLIQSIQSATHQKTSIQLQQAQKEQTQRPHAQFAQLTQRTQLIRQAHPAVRRTSDQQQQVQQVQQAQQHTPLHKLFSKDVQQQQEAADLANKSAHLIAGGAALVVMEPNARLSDILDYNADELANAKSTAKLISKASQAVETRRASSSDVGVGTTASSLFSTKRRTSFFEYATVRNGNAALQAPLIDERGTRPAVGGTESAGGGAAGGASHAGDAVGVLLTRRRCSSIEREKWASKFEFLLAVIGYAVDLGNIWRFPSVCYKHGGGAFLIPYLVMLVVGGLPMFYMELVLGQFHRSGCLSIWKKICPMFKGIGYGICFVCTFIACFYNAIIAHSVYFFFSSFAWEVPWKGCNQTWNTENCRVATDHRDASNASRGAYSTPSQEFYTRNVLEMNLSGGFDDLVGIKPSMALCLFLVFVAVYFALWKGPRSTGKAVWITATAPYVVLTILLIRGLTLPGASKGISFYLMPKFDKLLEPAVWTAAATQIFFSLGPGFGVLLALSSYNEFHNNCYRDAIVTSAINCFTSFFSGFVIFSTLGYMSEITNRPVAEVAGESESSLIFVVYPQAIATMNYSSIWSMIFFFMLITLGIDSTFSGIEALITGFCDEYPRILARKREIFVFFVVFSYYIGSLPAVTYGGTYVIPFLDEYGVSLSVLFIVMCEMIAVCWFYGVSRFSDDIRLMLGFYPGIYWRVCWTCCPIFIGLIFGLSLYSTSFTPMELPNYKYPQWSVWMGWILRLLSCLSVPLFAIYLFFTTSGTPMQRLKSIITPQQQRHASMNSTFSSLTFNNATLVVEEVGENDNAASSAALLKLNHKKEFINSTTSIGNSKTPRSYDQASVLTSNFVDTIVAGRGTSRSSSVAHL